jgi:hypothetical protein
MKQLASLYIKAIIIFVAVHITPAALATVLSFNLNTYMVWISCPLYHALMIFVSLIFTVYAVEVLNDETV